MFGLRKRIEKLERDLRVEKYSDYGFIVDSNSPLKILLEQLAKVEDLKFVIKQGSYHPYGGVTGRETISHDELFRLILNHLNLTVKLNPGQPANYELSPRVNQMNTSTVPGTACGNSFARVGAAPEKPKARKRSRKPKTPKPASGESE